MTYQEHEEIMKVLSEILKVQKELLALARPMFVVKRSPEMMEFLRDNMRNFRPGAVIPVTKEQMNMLQKNPFVPISGVTKDDLTRNNISPAVPNQSRPGESSEPERGEN